MIANMNSVSVTSPMGFQSQATSGIFATQGGGDFMAMFMQMLGMSSESENTEVQTFLNQFAEGEMSEISTSDDLMKELQSLLSDEEDLDINKLQEAAMLLMPMILPNIQVDQSIQDKSIPTLNSQIQAMTNQKVETNENKDVLQTLLQPKVNQNETETTDAMNMIKEVSTQSKPVVAQSFEQVVQVVKQSLEGKEKVEPVEIDIDELQKQVKSSRNDFVQTGVNFRDLSKIKEDVKVDPKMVLDQVTNGIKTKMASNESDFTMKLQPEGLGEITVKLVSEAGKLTVNIVATSQKTEQLLNSQLSSLRSSLDQTHSDIKEINVYKQADSMGFTNGKDFFNQQQQQSRQQHAYEQSQNKDSDSLDVTTMKDYQALMIAGLNRYV